MDIANLSGDRSYTDLHTETSTSPIDLCSLQCPVSRDYPSGSLIDPIDITEFPEFQGSGPSKSPLKTSNNTAIFLYDLSHTGREDTSATLPTNSLTATFKGSLDAFTDGAYEQMSNFSDPSWRDHTHFDLWYGIVPTIQNSLRPEIVGLFPGVPSYLQ